MFDTAFSDIGDLPSAIFSNSALDVNFAEGYRFHMAT